MAKPETKNKTIAENRRARFEYHVGETWEAGLMLTGTEVKALRKGGVNIQESYASYENDGLYLINSHIPEYRGAGRHLQHEPRRKRKLLMHTSEIAKLTIAVERKGLTVVPLEIYFNPKGIAKLRLALAEGKKLHDKRDAEKTRDWNREKSRLMRDKG